LPMSLAAPATDVPENPARLPVEKEPSVAGRENTTRTTGTTIRPMIHSSRAGIGFGMATLADARRPIVAAVRSAAATGTTQSVRVDRYNASRPVIHRNQNRPAHAPSTTVPATRVGLHLRGGPTSCRRRVPALLGATCCVPRRSRRGAGSGGLVIKRNCAFGHARPSTRLRTSMPWESS
jgi:hypothetical protein